MAVIARLTTPHGEAKLLGEVGREAIRDLLRAGAVRFVVAEVGQSLRGLPEQDRFEVWKREVQPHLAELGQHARLEQFPGEYVYFASQWEDEATPIILLSKTH